MAAYLLTIGTITSQLTAPLRRGRASAVSNAAARRSFLSVLLSTLAAWPC